jgi:HlyD family secretion protein
VRERGVGGRRSGATRIAIAAIAAIAMFSASCRQGETAAHESMALVRRERIERTIVATGTIEPRHEVQVRPRISGIIEKIAVAPGQLVEAGTQLMQIERALLEAQVREARAALLSTQIEERYAKIERARIEALRQKDATAARDLDEMRRRHELAGAAVARAAAAAESLQVQQSYTSIDAPIAGRVLDVHVERGDAVSAVTSVTGGTVLLSLAASSGLYFKGMIDENEVAHVRTGQSARIRSEAYPDRQFEGKVQQIAPVGERRQNVTYFELEIAIENDQDGLLRPRMSADAEIVSEIVSDALTVPETAIRYEGDRTYVERLTASERDRPESVDVELGIVAGDRVQILRGLQEGAQVLLD